MTFCVGARYNRSVHTILGRLGVAAAALGSVFLAVDCGRADAADPALYSVGPSPVLNVNINGGAVTIRTWERQAVQVESSGDPQVQQFAAAALSRNLPRELPVFSGTVDSPRGPLTLPEETFVLTPLASEPHDGIVVKGSGGATTITIPPNTALVVVRSGNALVNIDGYRQGTFFVRVQNGAVHIENSGGEGFVQLMRGPIVINDAAFTRLRARTAQGNMIFERVRAKQIEASSVAGSMIFDNGSFEPGLARFETQYGHVAMGIGGGDVQIGAHSNAGRIMTDFTRRANVVTRGSDGTASLGNNGPSVNVSAGGGVFLYDGSLDSRANRGPGWNQLHQIFTRVKERANITPPRSAESQRLPAQTRPPVFRPPAPMHPRRRTHPP